jgi:hypothetical protein
LRIGTIALRASGYRTNPDQPGHHAITLQTLPLTLGIDADATIALDAFRRKRNLAAYEGDEAVSEGDLGALLGTVIDLEQQLMAWLEEKHADLL